MAKKQSYISCHGFAFSKSVVVCLLPSAVVVAEPVGSLLAVTKTVEISFLF